MYNLFVPKNIAQVLSQKEYTTLILTYTLVPKVSELQCNRVIGIYEIIALIEHNERMHDVTVPVAVQFTDIDYLHIKITHNDEDLRICNGLVLRSEKRLEVEHYKP